MDCAHLPTTGATLRSSPGPEDFEVWTQEGKDHEDRISGHSLVRQSVAQEVLVWHLVTCYAPSAHCLGVLLLSNVPELAGWLHVDMETALLATPTGLQTSVASVRVTSLGMAEGIQIRALLPD